MTVGLILPNQLFEDHPVLDENPQRVVTIETEAFFNPRFHIQKLLLHRLSLQEYETGLQRRGYSVERVQVSTIDEIPEALKLTSGDSAFLADPVDHRIQFDLCEACRNAGIALRILPTPLLLTNQELLQSHFQDSRGPYMARFYREQRTHRQILLRPDGGPEGGKWSFDPANRKKLPKDHQPPDLWRPPLPEGLVATLENTRNEFPDAPGAAQEFLWPISHKHAVQALSDFIEKRLHLFGDYEDAVDPRHDYMYHSVLTPALNIGLLTPDEVVNAVLEAYRNDPDRYPINSVEGFVRQVAGWREFMAGTYRFRGQEMAESNHFRHRREVPESLYAGTTGLDPIDSVVAKVLRLGYAHHIERLMILGNFMVLAEIAPGAVYRWFMELFVDAYPWVMVPNVYGMSQYADGGGITTKPYVSSSNYLKKMTRFPKGQWCDVWDGLYWRFVSKHRALFESNRRLAVMTSHLDRMGKEKLEHHRHTAAEFLADFHGATVEEFLR